MVIAQAIHRQPMTASLTRNSILDAAEERFSAVGFNAASLRSISSCAQVNLGSVQYHFGSKTGLIRSVFSRRLRPINIERLGLLDALRNAPVAPRLEHILAAYIEPGISASRDPSRGGGRFVRLLGRTLTDPQPELKQILSDEYRNVIHRFSLALADVLPNLDHQALRLRMHFMIGSVAYAMAAQDQLDVLTEDLLTEISADRITRELVGFVAAGMRSEPSGLRHAFDPMP